MNALGIGSHARQRSSGTIVDERVGSEEEQIPALVDIRVLKVDGRIAVSVGRRQVLVVKRFFAVLQFALILKRFHGDPFSRQRSEVSLDESDGLLGGKPDLGIFVRQDLRPAFAQTRVGADVIVVPVGVDEPGDRGLRDFAGFGEHAFHGIGQAAINEQQTVGSFENADVPAGSGEHMKPGSKTGDLERRLLRLEAEECRRGGGQYGAKERSAMHCRSVTPLCGLARQARLRHGLRLAFIRAALESKDITMATATYDDVNLILRLYELRREERMRVARSWFLSSFKPKSVEDIGKLAPGGSDENAYYRMVVTYWEMAASFVTSGVLSEELFFQSGQELLVVYVRLREFIPTLRQNMKSPAMWKNLETVALHYIEWYEKKDPEAFQAFAARVS